MSISTAKIATGFAVIFPFALKDHFKKMFPTAKWNSNQKQWEVGVRSEKRLTQWILEAQPAADAVEEAQHAELTEMEIAKVRQELLAFKTVIDIARGQEGDFKQLQEVLQGERAKIADVKSKVAAAQVAAAAEKAKVLAFLSGIIDLELVTEQKGIMARNHTPSNPSRKKKFQNAQTIVEEQYELLKSAGFKSRGLYALVNSNVNRPDRDDVSRVTEEMILNISKIEP